MQIEPTDEQYLKKVFSLSTPAWFVFWDVKLNKVNQRTASIARSVPDKEWQALDWLKIVGGLPFDETNFTLVTDLAAEDIVSWLNG